MTVVVLLSLPLAMLSSTETPCLSYQIKQTKCNNKNKNDDDDDDDDDDDVDDDDHDEHLVFVQVTGCLFSALCFLGTPGRKYIGCIKYFSERKSFSSPSSSSFCFLTCEQF